MLEEIRDVNAQHEGVTFEQLIDKHLDKERKEIEEEEQIDEALAKCVWIELRMVCYTLIIFRAAFSKARSDLKRLKDDDLDDVTVLKKSKTDDQAGRSSSSKKKLLGGLVRKKTNNETVTESNPSTVKSSATSLGLLSAYTDDSSSSSD